MRCPLNQTTHTVHDAEGRVVGTLTAAYVYDAYGNTLAQSGPFADTNPYRFSSQYLDPETGLCMYTFRAYSPRLERWTSRDPIGERGGSSLYDFNVSGFTVNFDWRNRKKKCNTVETWWITDELGLYTHFKTNPRGPGLQEQRPGY